MTPELAAKIAGRTVVASVSGGKDSAALSLWLKEQGIEHRRVFMDTGWEHEATYEYLRGPLTQALGPIEEIRGDFDFVGLAMKKKGLPGGLTRFCTQELKLAPLRRHLGALQDRGIELVNAVGIRREESVSRADAPEWEWSDDLDCEVWRPLVGWTFADVVAIHQRHGLTPSPLYLEGFSRVGCFPCINANKDEIALLARRYPERIDVIRELERRVAEVSNADPKPTFFVLRDAAGRKHRRSIDDVVRWATRGGEQLLLSQDAAPGCMRWGICDTGGNP